MRKGATEPLQRRNIVMTHRTAERLADLRSKTEASTDTEVMRCALMLYDRVIESVLAGYRLQLVSPTGTIRELELLVGNGKSSLIRELEEAANGKNGGP